MAQQSLHDAFFSLPVGTWEDVFPAVADDLSSLQEQLSELLAGDARARESSPSLFALQLALLSRLIFDTLAPEERDVREVISTLRTALAACLDLCPETLRSQSTVAELMAQMRSAIDSFESDLVTLQSEETGDSDTSGNP